MQRALAIIFATLVLALPDTARPGDAQSAGSSVCGDEPIYNVALPGAPFGAVASPDERHLFVSINFANPRQPNGIAVLECSGGRYRFQRVVGVENQPSGMALTRDGGLLVVADDNFVAFVDPKRAVAASGDPILGFFEDIPGDDGGAVYANVTSDGRYAFISEEQSRTVTVIDLSKARSSKFARSSIIGEIPVGRAPVALVFSNDGKHLFSTAQVAPESFGFAKTCKTEGAAPADAKDEPPGAIITIDVAKAATDPEHSVVSRTAAGCHPVRASLSPNGETLWVTARASNALLEFSAAKLVAGDPQAKIAEVPLGAAPVPVIVTPDGKYVLAGNSNRFGQGAAGNQSVAVVDARTASVIGSFTVGRFPREFSRTRSGSKIFLTNYYSHTLTVISPDAIPRLITRS
jgi:DNA-binding beta-propeller fold protein YncE